MTAAAVISFCCVTVPRFRGLRQPAQGWQPPFQPRPACQRMQLQKIARSLGKGGRKNAYTGVLPVGQPFGKQECLYL